MYLTEDKILSLGIYCQQDRRHFFNWRHLDDISIFILFATNYKKYCNEWLLKFSYIDYILLLDVSDELRGGDKLRNFCKKEIVAQFGHTAHSKRFYLQQDDLFGSFLTSTSRPWSSLVEGDEQLDLLNSQSTFEICHACVA